MIRTVFEAGQRCFAENRVQEVVTKAAVLPGSIDWHFIGHLQKNKIRKVLPVCRTLHSIDTLELARQVDRIAGELGLRPEVYFEVNISGDDAKFGFHPEALRQSLHAILALENIEPLGLMTIPRFSAEPEDSRPHFAALRELGRELSEEAGAPLEGLSMGMSNDYEIAVEEGATVVRIGTEIFGPRGV